MANNRFMLVTKRTIHIPGDERSRTHPGHGYPESTEKVDHIEFYDTEVAITQAIDRLGHFVEYRVFSVQELKVKRETKISLETK